MKCKERLGIDIKSEKKIKKKNQHEKLHFYYQRPHLKSSKKKFHLNDLNVNIENYGN